MLASQINAIRDKLERIVGISPTQSWIQDCATALIEHDPSFDTNVSGDDDHLASAILDQILDHDLRDVVRESLDNENVSYENCSQASQLLRTSIRQSLESGDLTATITLPSAFRLLVQVEEFTDVSLNLEKRLEMVTSNKNGPPQTVNNNKNRCMKLCYTDGYWRANDGTISSSAKSSSENLEATRQRNRDAIPMIAMECTPLVGLGTNYPLAAGLKILLHGPIIIRHGVAGWHPGNATILGGSVRRLIEIQTQALNLAKQKAGHGIDPTIKALIWNNNPNHLQGVEGENEADDEGEHESRDIPAATQQQHQQRQQQQQQQNLVTAPLAPLQQSNQFTRQQIPSSSQQHSPPTATVCQRVPMTNPVSTTLTNSAVHGSSTLRSSSISLNTSENSLVSSYPVSALENTTNQAQQRSLNPYQRTALHVSSSSINTSTIIPEGTTAPRIVTLHQPPCRPTEYTVASAVSAFTPASALVQVAQAYSIRESTGSNFAPSIAVTVSSADTTTTRDSATKVVSVSSTPIISMTNNSKSNTLFTVISFQQLRDLLVRAVESEVVYRHAYGQVYAVHNMKQHGPKLYFNIEKNKNKKKQPEVKKNKAEKYEYVMTAKFQGEINNEGVITCKIASSILEPYFSLPPGDMRKLNKEDRSRSETLVKEGGQKLNQSLMQSNSYEVTLLLPPDEFFAPHNAASRSAIDGNNPILYILKQQ